MRQSVLAEHNKDVVTVFYSASTEYLLRATEDILTRRGYKMLAIYDHCVINATSTREGLGVESEK